MTCSPSLWEPEGPLSPDFDFNPPVVFPPGRRRSRILTTFRNAFLQVYGRPDADVELLSPVPLRKRVSSRLEQKILRELLRFHTASDGPRTPLHIALVFSLRRDLEALQRLERSSASGW